MNRKQTPNIDYENVLQIINCFDDTEVRNDYIAYNSLVSNNPSTLVKYRIAFRVKFTGRGANSLSRIIHVCEEMGLDVYIKSKTAFTNKNINASGLFYIIYSYTENIVDLANKLVEKLEIQEKCNLKLDKI